MPMTRQWDPSPALKETAVKKSLFIDQITHPRRLTCLFSMPKTKTERTDGEAESNAVRKKPRAIRRSNSANINQVAVTAVDPRRLSRQATVPSSMHAEEKEDTRSPGPREKPKRKDANLTGYGTMIENPDVIRLCTELGMSRQDVWQLRKEFNDEDSDSTDTITLTSFFFLIQEQNRDLTKALLRLAVKEGDQPPTRRLTFDEYLRCVVTFSSFTEIQVFQFFFQVYADITQQRSGGTTVITVGEDELVQLSQDLQMLQFAFAGNIQVAQAHFAPPSASPIGTSMENWTFTDFESFARQHRVAFYPLIRVQHNVRRAGGFSDGYWAKRIKERQVLAHVLTYMKKNHGLLPKLPWRDRIWSAVMQNPTTVKRVHDRAKNFYMSSQQ